MDNEAEIGGRTRRLGRRTRRCWRVKWRSSLRRPQKRRLQDVVAEVTAAHWTALFDLAVIKEDEEVDRETEACIVAGTERERESS